MANRAMQTRKLKVYSSYPIEQGTFVTPSKIEAQSYSGSENIYSKTINPKNVAWIDAFEGQYAKTDDVRYSNPTFKEITDDDLEEFHPREYNNLWLPRQEYAIVVSAIMGRALNDTSEHFKLRIIGSNDYLYMYYYDVNDNPHILAKAEGEFSDGKYKSFEQYVKALRRYYENNGNKFGSGTVSDRNVKDRRATKPNGRLSSGTIRQQGESERTGFNEVSSNNNLREEKLVERIKELLKTWRNIIMEKTLFLMHLEALNRAMEEYSKGTCEKLVHLLAQHNGHEHIVRSIHSLLVQPKTTEKELLQLMDSLSQENEDTQE